MKRPHLSIAVEDSVVLVITDARSPLAEVEQPSHRPHLLVTLQIQSCLFRVGQKSYSTLYCLMFTNSDSSLCEVHPSNRITLSSSCGCFNLVLFDRSVIFTLLIHLLLQIFSQGFNSPNYLLFVELQIFLFPAFHFARFH